jgi:hypothetical protein
MADENIRYGSAPNFCPPETEGTVLEFSDEAGDITRLEFLGMLVDDTSSYGFFFPVDEETPALSSGEVVIMHVVGFDDEGNPSDFELVEDEAIAAELYEKFQVATKDLYRFE